mmetsp:Transcript_13590/g.45961  ORF Transcript_13590/g.45961 Transcript_13590/m.45961 type:complete len:205 (+) Transcript_13590:219-833(+)
MSARHTVNFSLMSSSIRRYMPRRVASGSSLTALAASCARSAFITPAASMSSRASAACFSRCAADMPSSSRAARKRSPSICGVGAHAPSATGTAAWACGTSLRGLPPKPADVFMRCSTPSTCRRWPFLPAMTRASASYRPGVHVSPALAASLSSSRASSLSPRLPASPAASAYALGSAAAPALVIPRSHRPAAGSRAAASTRTAR